MTCTHDFNAHHPVMNGGGREAGKAQELCISFKHATRTGQGKRARERVKEGRIERVKRDTERVKEGRKKG